MTTTYAASLSSQLEKLSINLLVARADLEPVINACLASATLDNQPESQKLQRVFEAISTAEDLYAVLGDVANLLSKSVLPSQSWIVTPWTLLADLTKKNPQWRQVFGPLRRIPRDHDLDRSLSGGKGCILEAAVQSIQLAHASSLPPSAVRPILRLIANCCADNNVNRSLVINSSALNALQCLVVEGTEVEVLLPTLYNVCTEFDEPALNESGKPYKPPSQLVEAGFEAEYLTTAEAKLQIWQLMELDDKFLEGDSGALLANLIEMSSRSALFDISIILREDRLTQDEDLNQRAVSLSNKILHQGIKIARTSIEGQASICQACLNLYSQPILQRALAQSFKGIELFMELPYITVEDQDEEAIDLSPYRESFLKQLYAISALPEYQNLTLPGSALLTSLTQHLARYEVLGGVDDDDEGSVVDHGTQILSSTAAAATSSTELLLLRQNITAADNLSSPLPSVLALLNNALCDLERIEAFLNHQYHSRVCKSVMIILLHANTQPIILPSLKLVNRFALSPTGAKKLYAIDSHFSVISRLLKKNISSAISSQDHHRSQEVESQLEVPNIHGEIIAFARLLIKSSSSPSITLALIQNPIYKDQILLSLNTGVANQAEIARLNIAILRIIAGASLPSGSDSAENVTELQIASTITNSTNLTLLTSSLVSFLLTNNNNNNNNISSSSSNHSSNNEALFGLAIFASIFVTPTSVFYNPSVKPTLLSRMNEDQEQVINQLQNVATTKTIEEELTSTSKPDTDHLQILLTHLLSNSTTATAAASTITSTSTGTSSISTSSLLNHLKTIATQLGLQFS